MRNVLCVILGGGQGKRLYPLTKYRSKPAVPLAGKYRLIDVPISNCLNADMRKIYILTQFNSESLNKHISRSYHLDTFSRGFVEIMAAEQTMDNTNWFQGTADAVRRCLKHFNDPSFKYILILSGDQLYKMDLTHFVKSHIKRRAEISIACNPARPSDVSALGIMGVNGDERIDKFVEKPATIDPIKGMEYQHNGEEHYLASMGIYCFNANVLHKILTENTSPDFGHNIIPYAIPLYKTFACTHTGYWYDIGTIKAYYQANLDLAESNPALNLYHQNWRYFTHPRFLPPSKIERSTMDKVIVSDGTLITGATLERSVIGLRGVVRDGTSITGSVIMGSDYYSSDHPLDGRATRADVPLGIGKRCVIKNAILDKNVSLGDNVHIINKDKRDDYEADQYCIKSGIVIIEKNSIIPPGTVI